MSTGRQLPETELEVLEREDDDTELEVLDREDDTELEMVEALDLTEVDKNPESVEEVLDRRERNKTDWGKQGLVVKLSDVTGTEQRSDKQGVVLTSWLVSG